MRVRYETELVTTPVPRDTWAPWLDPKRDKSKLVEDFSVHIGGEHIVVPAGYVSDWSSTPRLIWWLYPPTYGPARRGCWVHDYLYSHLWREYSKAFADAALAACMRHDGAPERAVWLFHCATHHFGRGGWHRNQEPDAHPFWHRHREG